DLFDQQTRQRAARNCHITAAGRFHKDSFTKTADTSAPSIANPHLSDVVADSIYLAKPPALGYVLAKAPKIDDITSVAECECVFNQCGPKSTRTRAVRI